MFQYTMMPAAVYGKTPNVPPGYKVVGFRPIVQGDTFISIGYKDTPTCGKDPVIATAIMDGMLDEPRLIIERVKRKQIVFTATGEHRVPKLGEFYRSYENMFHRVEGITGSYDIYTREEREV